MHQRRVHPIRKAELILSIGLPKTYSMKILTAHNYYQQPGGEDAVFAAESALLRQKGHEVISFVDNNERIDQTSRLATAARTIWSSPSKAKLLELLRNERPDIAHFHNTFPLISPSTYDACRVFDVPVVQTLHNYRLLCPVGTFYRKGRVCEDCLGHTVPLPGIRHACYHGSRAKTSVITAMITFHHWIRTWQKKVDIYVALTEFSRRKFIEGGLPPEKIVVKPNFIHPDPGHDGRAPSHMLFVGRLAPEKGLKTLLDAWQSVGDIPLKIVGNGPLQHELRDLIKTRNLRCVEMLGQCSHDSVIEHMRKAHCLIFPSEWYEGFPLSIAEAFACGVPVIASRLGAMREIVDDERTGLHFAPGDFEDLARKVKWAWNHEKVIEEMGKSARRDYEKQYSAQGNYKMLLETYGLAIQKTQGHKSV